MNTDQNDERKILPGAKNFLSKFRDENTKLFLQISATDFLDCWQHYDVHNNGYIDGSELDSFIREFVTSVVSDQQGNEILSNMIFENLKMEFMNAYDVDKDGRINICEMSEILPADEAFVAIFRNEFPLSSGVEFIRVWRQLDKNNSGFIEVDELGNFLKHLFIQCGKTVSEDKLPQYVDTIIKLFDRDNDGRLQLSEMSRLLRVKNNYLRKPLLSNSSVMSRRDVEKIFNAYDTDRNGCLDSDELDGMLKDFLEAAGQNCEEDTISSMRTKLIEMLDKDKDGFIGMNELKFLLTQGLNIKEDVEEDS